MRIVQLERSVRWLDRVRLDGHTGHRAKTDEPAGAGPVSGCRSHTQQNIRPEGRLKK